LTRYYHRYRMNYMEIQVILKNFGLSQKEIAVYLALIELGPSSVRDISAKSKINRGTSYDILKSLIEIGIVSYYNKESKQYFIAEPPEKLLGAIDQKKEDLDELRKNIQNSLPLMKTLFEKQGGKPSVKLYEGAKGLRQILEDVLESLVQSPEKEYYLYSSSTAQDRKSIYADMPDFSKKRINKKINVKIISLGEGGQLVGLDERKQMPTEGKEVKSTHEIIYAGKVAHISLDDKEEPVGILIQNEAIYQTQKLIFGQIWKQL
jgi:sugar-specific transcriptional regulator TrmB